MASTLLTELGDKLITEPVSGLTGASTANDSTTRQIDVERFDSSPTVRGWLLGSGWAWNSTTLRLEFTP